MKKKVLWISSMVPYDDVKHAGGKNHNYYLKQLREKGNVDIELLTFANKSDIPSIDLEKYDIKYTVVCWNRYKREQILSLLMNAESRYNPFNRNGRAAQNYNIYKIKKFLSIRKKEGYIPDIVILQWTSVVFMLEYVKKVYPKTWIIAIEEDITYLAYQRKMENYQNVFKRWISRQSYNRVYRIETSRLKKADKVILNNHKDEQLAIKDGVSKENIFVWTPFFQNLFNTERKPISNNIIFYGAMNRQENYLSAIWFIENVMPLLVNIDIRFLIIGNRPHRCLMKYQSEKVQIVGYVQNICEYFSTAICMVAPLVLGAGVKIKIIEAMSAGLPILTNSIGIEGIGAKKGEEYFHCETPYEYQAAIRQLIDEPEINKRMSEKEKEFIVRNYDTAKSAREFIKVIENNG